MMQFQKLKESIIANVLVPAESGRYVTVGHQRQRDSAEVINGNSQVTLYFSEGDMPRAPAQAYGDVMHDVAFMVELTVATTAEIDISVLEDENSSANERAKAIRAISEASVLADERMDELINVVFQVLMDARNEQMGLNPPAERPNLKMVANRWIDQIRKDNPAQDGEYFILTASMRLNCRVGEFITGADLPAPPEDGAVFDSDTSLGGDDVAKQGVTQTTK